MEKLSLILVLIGLSVFIFSLWSFLLIKRHLRHLRAHGRHLSSLTDEKYFELKAKQEYLLAISAVIFSIIAFIGYTSIDNIKNDINNRLMAEVNKLDTLNKRTDETFMGLEIRGKTYQDSIESAFKVLAHLNHRIKQLFAKDVITQDIYIVDPLRIGDFPRDKSDVHDEHLHEIKFSSLRTVNGKRLPVFKERPSVICIANSMGSVRIREIFVDRFIVQLESFFPKNPNDRGDNVTFTAWISQRPSKTEFNGDFSDEFR